MRNLLARLSFATAVATLLVLGCGASISQRTSAGSTAFSTCAKADLDAALGSNATVGSVVGQIIPIIEAGLSNWMAELDKLTVGLTTDALDCIMDFVEAFLSPPAGSAATAMAPGALERARLYHAHVHLRAVHAQLDTTSSVVDQALAIVGAEQR